MNVNEAIAELARAATDQNSTAEDVLAKARQAISVASRETPDLEPLAEALRNAPRWIRSIGRSWRSPVGIEHFAKG